MRVHNLIAAEFALFYCCACIVAQTTAPAAPFDDATGIQSRLDALVARGGGKLTLTAPPAAFHIGHYLIIRDGHDIEIDGQGATFQCLGRLPIADANGDTLRLVNCRHITIRNLNFDGNRDARGGFNTNPETLRLNSCTDVLVEHCSFTSDVCDGIFAWGGFHPPSADRACRKLRIVGCSFSDPGRSCISMVGACDVLIEGSALEGAHLTRPGAALDIEANLGDPAGINHHISFVNNHVRGCALGVGIIQVCSPHDIIISGNFFEGMVSPARDWSSAGVFIQGENVVVMGNTFEPDAQGFAIDAEAGSSLINSNSYPKGRNVVGAGDHRFGVNQERTSTR